MMRRVMEIFKFCNFTVDELQFKKGAKNDLIRKKIPLLFLSYPSQPTSPP